MAGGETKHDVLRERLAAAIRDGRWAEGARLPGARPLAAEFGCSPGTMERVLDDLTAAGYLVRRPRSGSFVAPRAAWDRETVARPAVAVLGIPPASAVLEAAAEVLTAAGYALIARPVPASLDGALRAAAELAERAPRGFLWSPLSTRNHEADNRRLALALLEHGPAVAVDRYLKDMEIDCVVSDNARAAYRLTAHLIALGHRRIGLVRHTHGSTPDDRHQGYARALAEHGLPADPAWVAWAEHDSPQDELVATLRQWLRETRLTAAWAISGYPLGAALFAAAQAEGLNVPEDLSVAAFDGFVAPLPVTAVTQPLRETGARAAELLLEKITHPERNDIRRISLPCVLREGASCAPPRSV